MDIQTLKQHAIDFIKGLLAAIAVAAAQAAISYLAHIDWNHVFSVGLQTVAAVTAIKIKSIS